MAGTFAIVTVFVLAVVLGLGLLIFRLQRRAQEQVPRVADDAVRGERVVAVEADGSAVTAAEDAPQSPRPASGAFEQVLAEELEARHRHGLHGERGDGSPEG